MGREVPNATLEPVIVDMGGFPGVRWRPFVGQTSIKLHTCPPDAVTLTNEEALEMCRSAAGPGTWMPPASIAPWFGELAPAHKQALRDGCAGLWLAMTVFRW